MSAAASSRLAGSTSTNRPGSSGKSTYVPSGLACTPSDAHDGWTPDVGVMQARLTQEVPVSIRGSLSPMYNGPDGQSSESSHDEIRYTRGGWLPVGTSAQRRANQASSGTDRGDRTRSSLIAAARTVFAAKGYVEATVEDIVLEAQVARGTYYTYFPDKLAIFRVISTQISQEVSDAMRIGRHGSGGSIEGLAYSIRKYVEIYRANAAMYGLTEQVATIDPVTQEDRLERRRVHSQRISAAIRRWQRSGLADSALEPESTAAALLSMTNNFCYWWLVGHEEYDEEQAVATITNIWVRALKLRRRPTAAWRKQAGM